MTLALAPGDLERLADLIADRLADRPPAPLIVDVRGLAQVLGVSPDVIYRRQDELGALHIGRAVRFDVAEAVARSRRSPAAAAPAVPGAVRRRRSRSAAGAIPLLPIRHQPERKTQ